jgi:hypothetical protein
MHTPASSVQGPASGLTADLPLFAAAVGAQANPFTAALQAACSGPAAALPAELALALALLAERHLGAARAILGDELAAAAGYQGSPGCNGTRVRRLRQDLERHFLVLPIPVAASTDAGYYVPVLPEEVAHYRADLRSRARRILERARAFEQQLTASGQPDAAPKAQALDRLLAHLAAV